MFIYKDTINTPILTIPIQKVVRFLNNFLQTIIIKNIDIDFDKLLFFAKFQFPLVILTQNVYHLGRK